MPARRFCLASVAFADDFKTIYGKEYKNATVSRVEPDGILLRTKSGITKIYFTEFPKEVQDRFHYNAQQAAQFTYQTTAQTGEENRLTQQQQTQEAQKKAAQLEIQRQQQQADLQRQQREATQRQQGNQVQERRQSEQYHGMILVDHAEIDRDGRSYTVPSGILRPRN